ncbi:MAG: DUF192 domain-containing protein [Gammaproteobacteria bacterium]|nr:DUF192 domain-containing protein [Gammaproteobacteria bacterium]
MLVACGERNRLPIRVGAVAAEVEVARTPEQRMQGLMGRRELPPDQGMLLVFPQQKVLQLWMLNTEIALDVGFFDADGVLIQQIGMLPDGGRRIHSSSAPARYALEMNLGWFKRQGLEPGARLHLPALITAE